MVVGWAHPTTGAVAKCAPSNGIDPFDLIEGMTDLLNAGYAVAAADYPGLGVAGPSSYLIGTTEGNSVLDAIRAAQNMPETGAINRSDVLLWGHSQGGQAALFAGQDATSYAPELRVKAVAVAAPAADLGALLMITPTTSPASPSVPMPMRPIRPPTLHGFPGSRSIRC